MDNDYWSGKLSARGYHWKGALGAYAALRADYIKRDLVLAKNKAEASRLQR